MGWASDRQDIADLLSAVEGLTGHAYRPRVVAPGSAWPTLVRVDRRPGGFQATWKILVALSGDEPTATTRADDLLPSMLPALEQAVYVDSVIPVALTTGAGDAYALEITVRSE
jgi:hypothetical protein